MNGKHLFLAAALSVLTALSLQAADKVYRLQSPSGELAVEITTGAETRWCVEKDGVRVLAPSTLSMTLEDGTVFGRDVKVKKQVRSSVDRVVTPVVYRQAQVRERYNELSLRCNGYSLVFRAYDEGAAYRFVADRKAPFLVKDEEASFSFGTDCRGFIPYCRKLGEGIECQYFTSFEAQYSRIPLNEWESGRLAFLPVTLEAPAGMKVCITESDLLDYPGMYLSNEEKDTALEAVFAPYPREVVQGGHNLLQGLVQSREPYIARADADASFPWRIVIVAREDKDLLTCDLPWLLGREPRKDLDFSWVKPGKVAWDWWNDWNLYGVDFEAGINNDTYKYYIDFASRQGIEYVILDEGWAVNKQADLFQVVPEIDLPMLCQYAESKGVGLILWAGYWAFAKDMERACREYSAMGVKGFKVDFMDRDDQPMVDFYRRAAEMAARYHLMLDFHGAFKPAGIQRTWPNVVNFEGVFGLEQAKWADPSTVDQVSYEVSIPFVRLVAGPADYTQGAMRNATRGNFRPVNSEPMSQGTRCRQLAQYVVFDAPLTMLCDAPSNYLKEPECLHFIASVPTVWDETVALAGKAGEYVAMARRKGDTWYVGAMTDWNAREMTLDLSFIQGVSTLDIFRDGANAHRAARDYRKETLPFPEDGKITLKMAPGGGWVAVLPSLPPVPKQDHDWARAGYYAQENAAWQRQRPLAVLMGDSITRGWSRQDGGWLQVHGFAGRGISGQTTSQMLVRFRPDVLELHPRYVVILAGINDLARNNGVIEVKDVFGNIVSMCELAESHGIAPVLCSLMPANAIGWRKDLGNPTQKILQLNALLKEYAEGKGYPFVDYYTPMADENGALKAAYAQDAVHPSLEGYHKMEEILLSSVDFRPDSLKVMSYNIRYGTAKDGPNNWPLRREAAAAMILDQSPAVFGVQEALPMQLDYLAEACPMYRWVGVGRDDGKEKGEFMSVFYDTTRVSMVKWGTYWLSETPEEPSLGWDAACKRTATWALLKDRSNGKSFFFVNTHLDHVGVEARKRGLELLTSRIGAMNPDGFPMILCGDFNIYPDDPGLTELRELMQDARESAPVTDRALTFHGWGKVENADPIDFIFWRGFCACTEFARVVKPYLGFTYVSDHYPITAEFTY